MATVAPSAETKAAELLQNLSLESECQTIGVPEPAKKSGHGSAANGVTKPFNPNASFVPNGDTSNAYYYQGYDRQGEWNIYSRYPNPAQGVLGDNSSYMYHQGYSYTPYAAYPPHSSPSIQHDNELYRMQQYQYPCSYYQSPASANGSFAANETTVQQGKISNNVTPEHGFSPVMNEESMVGVVNEDSKNNNGLNQFLSSSQHKSLNSNDPYHRAGFPVCVPVSGYQDPKVATHGTQSAIPSDPLLFSDKQSKHGAKFGLSSPVMHGNDFSSQGNATIPPPHPFMNLHNSIHSSGFDLVSRFINGMYPSSPMFNPYGNTYGAGSRFGPAPYGFRTGYVGNKLKVTSGGHLVDHVKRNTYGVGELNKGPRAANSYEPSDDKSIKGLEPVTSSPKEQNISINSDKKEVPLVPNKGEYTGKDFSENYSDAKIFIIKSYSEDDIHKSIKYNVWASTLNGNKKLDAAYQEAKEKPGECPVFLLFSVNTSGQFVGLAEMVGPVDFSKTLEYWQQDRWTGCFPVKWHIIKDIPNSVLRHITLENNESKPVTNSRDTQEVKFEKGMQILKIFKDHSGKTCILDDFEFYEAREKIIQERKSKEQSPKLVSKSNDLTTNGTVMISKSHDGTLVTESAIADAGGEEKVNGLIPAPEDS